jgi:hypothetical protein
MKYLNIRTALLITYVIAAVVVYLDLTNFRPF